MICANNKALSIFSLVLLAATIAPTHAAEHGVRINAAKATFEPAYLKIQPGDTVKFIPIGKSKTVTATSTLVPDGAYHWQGIPGKSLSAKLSREGIYLYQSNKHVAKGMVGVIQVGSAVNLDQAKTRAQQIAKQAGGGARLLALLSSVERSIASTSRTTEDIKPKPTAVQLPAGAPLAQSDTSSATAATVTAQAPIAQSNPASAAPKPPVQPPAPVRAALPTQAATPANETTLGEVSVKSTRPLLGAASEPIKDYRPDNSNALGIDLLTQQLPATVNVVGAEFLRDFNIKGLNDLANFIPGVTLDDNGGENGENILIRGFSTSTVFVDGLRSRARYGVPRSLPDVLERVEVTKGPAGAEVGIAEFGGTVNLVTKKPLPTFAAEIKAGIGDFGYRKLGADITGPLAFDGALQGRFIAAYEEGAEWRKGRPGKTPRYVIAPSLNWDYSDRGSLLLQYERYYQDSPQDRGIVYLEGAFSGSNFAPRDWSFHQSDDHSRRTFDRIALDWQHRASDSLSARVRLQQYKEKRHLEEFRNADSEPVNGESFDLYNDDGRSWNGNRIIAISYSDWKENYVTRNAVAELTGRFGLGDTRHTLRGGLEQYRFKILEGSEFADISNENTIDVFDLNNNQRPINLTENGSPFVDSGGSKQNSAYATWLGQWTPQWRTVLGVRHDRFRDEQETRVDGVLDFGFSQRSDTTSLRLATSYDITPSVSIFAGASNAFQPQSGATRGGGQLEPTGGKSFEAGVKVSLFNAKALWTNSIYQITQDNITACDKDPSLTQEQIDNCTFNVLFGSARIRGIESEIQGAITPNLQVSGGFALMQSRITKTDAVYESDAARLGQSFEGNRFANTPEKQFSLALTYAWREWGLAKLKTSLGVVHVGQRYGNQGNTISLPSYTLVDVGVSYRFGAKTTLALNVSNLLDETYYTAMQSSSDRADQVGVGNRRLMQLLLRQVF